MPRPLILAVLAVCPALILGACATGPERATAGHYATDQDRLQSECAARGGFLVPNGHLTGQPETENSCRINGGASRIQ